MTEQIREHHRIEYPYIGYPYRPAFNNQLWLQSGIKPLIRSPRSSICEHFWIEKCCKQIRLFRSFTRRWFQTRVRRLVGHQNHSSHRADRSSRLSDNFGQIFIILVLGLESLYQTLLKPTPTAHIPQIIVGLSVGRTDCENRIW